MSHKMGQWIPLVPQLPRLIVQADPAGGVLRPWVRQLPLRCQGSLLTAIRGCDVAEKEDKAKDLNRMIRRATLNPADVRETAAAGGFFGFDAERLVESTKGLLHSLDHYPLHYIMHLTHACEIIGYAGCPSFRHVREINETVSMPALVVSQFFLEVYRDICFTLHVNPETREQLLDRLTLDRWSAGTTERNL